MRFNAGSDDDLARLGAQRGVQRLLHALGDARGVRGILEVVQQHREFVSAQTGQYVARTHAALQPPRDARDKPVAGEMTETVVDLLEPIEIEEEERDRLVGPPLHAGHGAVQRFEEVSTVDEPGEPVVHRGAAKLFLGALPGADVGHRTGDA
jgi:hypothetical protein